MLMKRWSLWTTQRTVIILYKSSRVIFNRDQDLRLICNRSLSSRSKECLWRFRIYFKVVCKRITGQPGWSLNSQGNDLIEARALREAIGETDLRSSPLWTGNQKKLKEWIWIPWEVLENLITHSNMGITQSPLFKRNLDKSTKTGHSIRNNHK